MLSLLLQSVGTNVNVPSNTDDLMEHERNIDADILLRSSTHTLRRGALRAAMLLLPTSYLETRDQLRVGE